MLTAESSDPEVRLAAVTDYLREAIARRRTLGDGERHRSRLVPSQFSESVRQVELTAVVNPHLPIAWPHWPPGLFPKVRALLQKVTRRLLAWYINPIVAQQNAFNHSVLRALQDSDHSIQDLSSRLNALELACQLLKDQLAPSGPAEAPEASEAEPPVGNRPLPSPAQAPRPPSPA